MSSIPRSMQHDLIYIFAGWLVISGCWIAYSPDPSWPIIAIGVGYGYAASLFLLVKWGLLGDG